MKNIKYCFQKDINTSFGDPWIKWEKKHCNQKHVYFYVITPAMGAGSDLGDLNGVLHRMVLSTDDVRYLMEKMEIVHSNLLNKKIKLAVMPKEKSHYDVMTLKGRL